MGITCFVYHCQPTVRVDDIAYKSTDGSKAIQALHSVQLSHVEICTGRDCGRSTHKLDQLCFSLLEVLLALAAGLSLCVLDDLYFAEFLEDLIGIRSIGVLECLIAPPPYGGRHNYGWKQMKEMDYTLYGKLTLDSYRRTESVHKHHELVLLTYVRIAATTPLPRAL